jgi:hypothetical protein
MSSGDRLAARIEYHRIMRRPDLAGRDGDPLADDIPVRAQGGVKDLGAGLLAVEPAQVQSASGIKEQLGPERPVGGQIESLIGDDRSLLV